MILRAEYQKVEQQIEKMNSELKEMQGLHQDDQIKAAQRLQEEKDKQTRLERELKAGAKEIEELGQMVNWVSEEESANRKKIDILQNENSALRMKSEEFQKKAEREKEIADQLREKRAKELQDRWKIHFSRLTYDPKVFKDFAEAEYDIRLALEATVKELNDAKDPRALNKNHGKMANSGEDHMEVAVTWRLYYRLEDGHIRLTRFQHKNKQERTYRRK